MTGGGGGVGWGGVNRGPGPGWVGFWPEPGVVVVATHRLSQGGEHVWSRFVVLWLRRSLEQRWTMFFFPLSSVANISILGGFKALCKI